MPDRLLFSGFQGRSNGIPVCGNKNNGLSLTDDQDAVLSIQMWEWKSLNELVTFILGMVKHPHVAMSICCDVSNTFMMSPSKKKRVNQDEFIANVI